MVMMEQRLETYAEQMQRLDPGDREERELLVSQLVELYCGEMFEELSEATSFNYVPLQYGLLKQSRI